MGPRRLPHHETHHNHPRRGRRHRNRRRRDRHRVLELVVVQRDDQAAQHVARQDRRRLRRATRSTCSRRTTTARAPARARAPRTGRPLTVKGTPKAGSGLKASKLGTTKRSDGRTQVTYGGHPLYTFVVDAGKPGSVKGEGVKAFGAEWYVVGANGRKVEKTSSSSTTTTTKSATPAPYGY